MLCDFKKTAFVCSLVIALQEIRHHLEEFSSVPFLSSHERSKLQMREERALDSIV